METLAELRAMLKRLEAKWDSGVTGDSHEFMLTGRQMKGFRKRIRELEG